MDDFDLIVSNYRCFPGEDAITFRYSEGFTALVGPNNAGKSALLRLLVELRPILDALRGWNEGEATLDASVEDSEAIMSHRRMGPLKLKLRVNFDHPANDGSQHCTEAMLVVNPIESNSRNVRYKVTWHNMLRVMRPADGGFDTKPNFHTQPVDAAISAIKNIMYIPAERNAIERGVDAKHFDISVGMAFVSQWDQMKNGTSRKHAAIATKIQRDIERLLNIGRLDIARASKQNRLMCHIDGHTYQLEELGSGIQHMLVVLAQAALVKPSFILIDEPEIGLHPSLQVQYLNTLGAYAQCGVIFSTHQYGLALAAAERVYCVIPVSHGISRLTPYVVGDSDLAAFAGSLQYGVFGAMAERSVLLVEGPTELRVIAEFMSVLDLPRSILVIHMGGGTTINGQAADQLGGLRRIASRVLAIVDSDRDHDRGLPSQAVCDFVKVCERIGIDCHVTERRATENYFSQKALHAAFGTSVRSLTPFEEFDPRVHGWRKRANWRAAREMSREEILTTDLGTVLQRFAAGESTKERR